LSFSTAQLLSQHDEYGPSRTAMILFRPNALKCLTKSIAPALRATTHQSLSRHYAVRHFASTQAKYRKTVDFTQKQDVASEIPSKDEATPDAEKGPKGTRKNAAKTSSLRRVAVEAQRSRGFVKGRGSRRFVDPDVDTKVRIPDAEVIQIF
jgi:hypothetical protein